MNLYQVNILFTLSLHLYIVRIFKLLVDFELVRNDFIILE